MSSCDLMIAVKRPADKILGQYGFALAFQLSRERSKKTEEVFLVGSRESEGKSKSPPNREFSSRFGKEEMSTEDKRRRLRRLVPPWSFLTRQRFLLEKQKKMLMGSCKSVQSTSLLKDFWKRQGCPYEGEAVAARRRMRWGQGTYSRAKTGRPCGRPVGVRGIISSLRLLFPG